MILKHLKQIIFLVFGITCISIILCIVLFIGIQSRENKTEVIFLDVGQGDSILIKTKYGQNILIDGGKDNKVLDRLGRNLSFFDKKLDIVIATHSDSDHIGGLVPVLERYDVDLFLDSGVIHDSVIYSALWDIIKQKQIPVHYISKRQIYDLGENMFIDILYPNIDFIGKDIDDNNLASIVAKFTDKEIDYMLTGDAPIEVEDELVLEFGNYLESEIFKTGHHGSKYSSGELFLDAVKPEVSVISVGRNNSFGHPTFRVLKNLENRAIKIFRTDEIGDIRFISDGEFIELR